MLSYLALGVDHRETVITHGYPTTVLCIPRPQSALVSFPTNHNVNISDTNSVPIIGFHIHSPLSQRLKKSKLASD